MQNHLQNYRPVTNKIILAIIALGVLFLLIGCGQLYKKLGLTPEQSAAQVQKDQTTTAIIVDQFRATTSDIITTALAGLGAIASGILAKYLGTERKITAILINTIEDSDIDNIKTIVQKKAKKAGIEPALNKRVTALT